MSRTTLLVVCTLAALAPAAHAAEFSGRSLIARCRAYADDPRSDRGQLCASFVTGFLAGLAASDPADADRETYSERALRTRLGLRLIRGRSNDCVDPSISPDVLIGQLLAHAAERAPEADVTASNFLSDILQRFHACDLLEHRRSL